ncbi:MAG: PD-(D/E)XK nuclease family protein [Gemmatimonadales bacterium]
MPLLLDALVRHTRAAPAARRTLLGPDINWGREVLRTLARETGGWIGWRAATLRSLADELAFVPMAARERRAGDDVEIAALVNRALDQELEAGKLSVRFARHGMGLGFRQAVRDAVLELRAAGVDADRVAEQADRHGAGPDLARVLAAYTRLLAEVRLEDAAGVFRNALEHFDEQAPVTLDREICIAPALVARGLPGRLLERLLQHGATVLPADPIPGTAASAASAEARAGATPPAGSGPATALSYLHDPTGLPTALSPLTADLDLFFAATPADEVREVLRRALAEGRRWDEVELAVTDPDRYGLLVEGICARLGIPFSSLHGIPLSRTRVGRALEHYFEWMLEGLPADVIRQALEAGEIVVPGQSASGTSVAEAFRLLGVGWGRARYGAALERIRSGRFLRFVTGAREDEEPDARGRERWEPRIAAVERLLDHLLAVTPEVRERGGVDTVTSTPQAIAEAGLGFLRLLVPQGAAEEYAMGRLQARLERLARVSEPERSIEGSIAAVRESLSELRAWSAASAESRPWSQGGGRIHLTDLVHAGATGRPRIFVLGLDADRTAGIRLQDPLLVDADRRRVADADLPGVPIRAAERRRAIDAALVGLRGRITFSYSCLNEQGESEIGPSALLLQVFRLVAGDATRSYEDLRQYLGPPAGAIPRGEARLDSRDVWLDALALDGLLRDGTAVLASAFPQLGAGLAAESARGGDELSSFHGHLPEAAGRYAPGQWDRRFSPSSLETLATCPLRWFYRYALGAYPPDDPEYDPERWLDPLARGALLHRVYEQFTREYRDRPADALRPEAEERIRLILDQEIVATRDLVPPPSNTVFAAEVADLAIDALSFIEMQREHGAGARWIEMELAFGGGPPVHYPAGPAGLKVRGQIDRVDQLADGSLRIIDYKTGRSDWYTRDPKLGPFRGGRRLQPAIYAVAAEQVLKRGVSRSEYWFPTQKGRNRAVGYGRDELTAAEAVVASLMTHLREGNFVPTNEEDDCKLCDYRDVCRVTVSDWGKVDSPLARWASEYGQLHPAFGEMRNRRRRQG